MTKCTPKRPRGVILWEGPSRINGEPIVVIAVLHSENRKTGNMVQVFYLYRDQSPTVAINEGLDEAICGSCPLRGILANNGNGRTTNRMRGCYVNVGQSPYAVWQAYQNGTYPQYERAAHARFFRGRKIRLGAYGCPTSAPYWVSSSIAKLGSGHTGYTHEWRNGENWRFRRLLMASCETFDQANQAQANGWRTFRSRKPGEPLAAGEIECPASELAGKRLTCAECGACNGSGTSAARVSVSIEAHGSPATLSSYLATMDDER